jgi:hypothetical protein
LIDIGVEHVFRETLDSALRISAEALSKLGHKRYQVFRAAKIFRKHDEKYLRELAVIRHDRKELIREAKQRIEDLENLLLTEKKNIGKDKDLGWDTASLLDEYGKR